MLSYAAVLLASSLALGAQEPAGQADFSKMQAFIGTWEASDIENNGQKLRAPISWQPILDGRFIDSRWLAIADGTKRTGHVTFAFLDKDNYKWAIQYDDGEESTAIFKRTQHAKDLWPERNSQTPDNLSEQLNDVAWWAGDCSLEGSDAFTGKTTVGQSTSGWVLDGKILLYDIASVDSDLQVSRYRAVVGVDPATGKTTGWEFESTGTVGKYTGSDKGQDIVGKATSPEAGVLEYKGRMTKTADGYEYSATGNLPHDKKTNYHGVWRKR
jgi:hypothetical protein